MKERKEENNCRNKTRGMKMEKKNNKKETDGRTQTRNGKELTRDCKRKKTDWREAGNK